MACKYLNSAGTDLDNLFLVDNSQGGGIGYLISTNVDLGNRFSNKSTLGYSIGYKNSAGTDVGYLRGKLNKPTITLISNNHNRVTTRVTCCDQNNEDCLTWEGYAGNRTIVVQTDVANITNIVVTPNEASAKQGYVSVTGHCREGNNYGDYYTYTYENTSPVISGNKITIYICYPTSYREEYTKGSITFTNAAGSTTITV